MRLLAICMLCPQPWTKMPPPPWELFVIPRPSMLDGLHWKLLGFGLCAVAVLGPQLAAVNRVVPVGKPPGSPAMGAKGSCPWKSTPFDNTVIAAPSRAPISDGSCNISARLPLRLASQPTVASSGRRSTCGLLGVAVKLLHPVPGQLNVPLGSNGFVPLLAV